MSNKHSPLTKMN